MIKWCELDKFWQIFHAKKQFWHIFDKNFEKNGKFGWNVAKKSGHLVRDCLKLVVNYSERGSPGESKTKKGVNGWEPPMQLASGCMWIWFANSIPAFIGFLRALLLHLKIRILPYLLIVHQSTLIHSSSQSAVHSIPRIRNLIKWWHSIRVELSWVERVNKGGQPSPSPISS